MPPSYYPSQGRERISKIAQLAGPYFSGIYGLRKIGIDLWPGVLTVCSLDSWTLSRDPAAPRDGRTLPHGRHPLWDPASLPTLPTLCPMEQLGDGHPYLYLLDLILNPLDGVAIDVVPGVHLLLADHFGPDHCKTHRRRGEQRPGDTILAPRMGKGQQ